MAFFTPPEGPEWLEHMGVAFVSARESVVPEEVLRDVLAEGERGERGVVTMHPPEPNDEFSGVGAWHVNESFEAHLLREGRGLVQFVTPNGTVTVVVEAGDVMIIRGAEHRFRPLTAVTWVLHYGGPEGADLVTRNTGRADDPWPIP